MGGSENCTKRVGGRSNEVSSLASLNSLTGYEVAEAVGSNAG